MLCVRGVNSFFVKRTNLLYFVMSGIGSPSPSSLPFGSLEGQSRTPPHPKSRSQHKASPRPTPNSSSPKSPGYAGLSTDCYLQRWPRPSELAGYKAAGVLPYRFVQLPSGEYRPEVLMGSENRVDFKKNSEYGICVNFLGGKREPSDATVAHTAVREFHEETGQVLAEEVVQAIIDTLVPRDSVVPRAPGSPPAASLTVPVTVESRFAADTEGFSVGASSSASAMAPAGSAIATGASSAAVADDSIPLKPLRLASDEPPSGNAAQHLPPVSERSDAAAVDEDRGPHAKQSQHTFSSRPMNPLAPAFTPSFVDGPLPAVDSVTGDLSGALRSLSLGADSRAPPLQPQSPDGLLATPPPNRVASGNGAAHESAMYNDPGVFWYLHGKYCLFLYRMEHDGDIDRRYRRIRPADRPTDSDMEDLHWIPVASLIDALRTSDMKLLVPGDNGSETEMKIYHFAASIFHFRHPLYRFLQSMVSLRR
eukprot:TRINITY_DN7206_c0_g1_i1.p1 TRINITY_DN7206_c0_g1~~TRINITY_DN7206_c0_g1_i1.p1  ORF type:complete len:479 (+),score=78.06 TRINITY_DN7206_c0_g1_i1:313-1749(+)